MILKHTLAVLLFLLATVGATAQIVVVPIPQSVEPAASDAHARTKALTLPFFDDFSSTKTTNADPKRWFAGRSIVVNDGMAIHPPSIKVATFDGVDSLGHPYTTTDILAKGFADKLESVAIDLTTVPISGRDSVYLSYMYQLKGNGELPDQGDQLLVSFLDKDQVWVAADTIENDGSQAVDAFYTSVIKIADARFFHSGFRIRFQNFARLSGPYDTWHVDYIYLNKGRTASDLSFPDRTLSEQLTSLLGAYRMIPIDHFRRNIAGLLTHPSVTATNMKSGNIQPTAISTYVTFTYRDNKAITKMPRVILDDSLGMTDPLEKGKFVKYTSSKLPDFSPIPNTADSIGIEFMLGLNSGDNAAPPRKTDYDPKIYAPIDFRYSDTTRASFLLLNKYAYDDGVAEYGAGLNQPGAQLAYEYNTVGVDDGYVTYLEMYFPRFGDESSQVIELRIWNSLDEDPVYQEVTSLQRSEFNNFWVKRLIQPVAVKKKFYIGWKQNSAAIIAAGLDKNNDSGDKMYSNTNGSWIENTTVHGSLMFRPIFGVGTSDPTGLEDEAPLVAYPNPNQGSFFLGGRADRVIVYDLMGRSIPIALTSSLEETAITLEGVVPGIYIVKAFYEGVTKTTKIMVR